MGELSQFNSSLKELLNADSLFRWEVHALDENRYEEDLYRAEPFFNIVSALLEIHKVYHQKNYSTALELVNKLERTYANILENDTHSILQKISRAVDHVIQISKTTILLHCGKTQECFQTLSKMPSRGILNDVDEAAILAIRSACCGLYSYSGLRDAQTFVDRAIKKDGKPFWRFLKAAFLYKNRNAINLVDPPSLEEIEILKKVNEEEPENPLFMVYLADVYRESAKSNKNKKELDFWFVPQESRHSLKTETEDMFKEAKTLYENAYKLRSRCSFVAFRCANGLMKLPQQHQNIKVAKEILADFSENMENSGYGNATAAFYYHNFGGKPDLAKNCLEAAMKMNVFNAHINNVKLMYKENRGTFKIGLLKNLLDIFQEAPKRKIIYAQLISFNLFIKEDLKVACENVMEYLKIGGPRNSLERHVSCFLEIGESFSLVDVVADQVKFTLNNPKLSSELGEFYNRFIHFTHFYNLNLDWRSSPQNFKKQILNKIIPEMKSKVLPEPRLNTNPRYGANRTPNQAGGVSKTQYRKPGPPNAPPRNSQHPKNKPVQSNSQPRFPKQIPNEKAATNLPKKPTPDSNAQAGKRELETQIEPDKKDVRKYEEQAARDKDSHSHGERKNRRNRHSSVSSEYSDHDRRSKKKHHRRRKYSTSSESDSPDRRRRSPSPSRRRHRSKEYKKHRDGKSRRYRRLSTSSDSSSSYDRKYKKKGRKHDRHRSSSSSSSSSERYEKKKRDRRHRERNPRSGDDEGNSHISKKLTEMSLNDHSSSKGKTEAANRQK